LTSFYEGYDKGSVFLTTVPDITNLKARITDAFATITEDILENTWRETDYYSGEITNKMQPCNRIYYSTVY
jgi:hypothetical protein